MSGIRVQSVEKWFGNVPALRNVNLEISEGEFFVLLGPSGCGKTTLLRCIAGIDQPTVGDIYLGNRCVFSRDADVDVPPTQRRTGMVFQNYALYPHMTVYQNVAFGLKVRRVPREQVARRVREALSLVDLSGFESRRPRELSGGQQQRVAVARTVVSEPRVLLFDEPLSNLDPKLRVAVRVQLKRLHRRMGATSLYVTHDQAEAMILGDRIGVLQNGVIAQVGTGDELYHYPETVDVAEFTGDPKTNLVAGEVIQVEGRVLLAPDEDPYCLIALPEACRRYVGSHVVVHARPENLRLNTSPAPEEGQASVLAVMVEGPSVYVHLRLGEERGELLAKSRPPEHVDLDPGTRMGLRFVRGNVYHSEDRRLAGSFGGEAEEDSVPRAG
jgi:multiple sugar transport system ATP-binding protein